MARFLIWNGGVRRQDKDVGSGYVQNIGVGVASPSSGSSGGGRTTGHRQDRAQVDVEPMEPDDGRRKDRPGGRIPII